MRKDYYERRNVSLHLYSPLAHLLQDPSQVTREKNRSYIETPPFERTTHDPHHRFCHQERCFHPRNCSRLLLYRTRGQLPDEARCWCSAAFHRAP
nr:MAG TPA: hypothetical protein [Caudoviricetes sp.]